MLLERETVASTSRTAEWHRVCAIATGGRVVGPRRYRSASAIARSLRQASATASPRARAASSCTSAGSRRSKKRRFLQNRDLPRSGLKAWRLFGGNLGDSEAFKGVRNDTTGEAFRRRWRRSALESGTTRRAPGRWLTVEGQIAAAVAHETGA